MTSKIPSWLPPLTCLAAAALPGPEHLLVAALGLSLWLVVQMLGPEASGDVFILGFAFGAPVAMAIAAIDHNPPGLWFAIVGLAVAVAAPSNGRLAYAWATLYLFTLAIVYFSGGAGGADPLRTWLEHTFHMTAAQAEPVVYGIRKTIHFTAYGTAAISALLTAKWGGSSNAVAIRIGLLIPLLLSCFDELRQSLVATRTGQVSDVVLDMVGAGIALAIAVKLFRFLTAKAAS